MKFISVIFIYTCLNLTFAQDLVDDVASVGLGEQTQIFTEQVRIISRSKKIFILTNTNGLLNKGDFITLILNDKDAAARAVVAKNHNSLVGIKILKIYSLNHWSKIRKGMDIKILKGDDSILFVKEEEKKTEEEEKQIKEEEDLYAEELALEDSLNEDGFGNENRLIKPDNIVGFAYGRFTFTDSNQNQDFGGHQLTGSWAYQFQDNFWFEGLISFTNIDSYPDPGDETVIQPLTARLKYTIKAPLYSYIMPYIGFQINIVDSPNATTLEEKDEVEKLGENKVAIGVTILRRMVPGWFLKADLGTDMLNIGAAVEF